MNAVNGACFFTELEGLLVQAHDRGLVNENALRDVLAELVAGEPLSVPMLMHVFGVVTIYRLMRGELAAVFTSAAEQIEAQDPGLAETARQCGLQILKGGT